MLLYKYSVQQRTTMYYVVVHRCALTYIQYTVVTSTGARLHQFVRGCETAANVHSRFCDFSRAPELPASSSHHPRQQLHKAPSPVSVAHAQSTTRGDCERSRCRQPAELGSAACACAVQRTLVELQEAWAHSALAITCRVPLNGGCCQLRAACRRHHNGSSGELSASLRKCGGDRQRRLQRRHGRWSRAGI